VTPSLPRPSLARVRTGVLLMLCGLVLNALVTEANAGAMRVVEMPSTLRPVSPMWRVATSNTRLPLLADQARVGLFSVGDLAVAPLLLRFTYNEP
jgi:hypothetical protein